MKLLLAATKFYLNREAGALSDSEVEQLNTVSILKSIGAAEGKGDKLIEAFEPDHKYGHLNSFGL